MFISMKKLEGSERRNGLVVFEYVYNILRQDVI